MAEVCRLLVEHLVGRIEEPGSEPGHDLVRPEFVPRPSSGAEVKVAPGPERDSGIAPLPEAGPPMTGWELAEDSLVPTLLPWKESLFTISNGYLGTRGTFEEGIAGETRATFINGLFVTPPGELPLLGAVPDWTGWSLPWTASRSISASGPRPGTAGCSISGTGLLERSCCGRGQRAVPSAFASAGWPRWSSRIWWGSRWRPRRLPILWT